jgi:hypothetical protein
MNPYYHSMSYATTAQQLNALHVWSNGQNFGPDYDSRMRGYLDIEEGNEQVWMDELMGNALAHFFHAGTENFESPRGQLNSLMMQCGLLDYLGGNFGSLPDWELDFHERCYLMSRVSYVSFLENQQVNADDQGVIATYADGQDKYDRGTWELLPN